MRTTLRLVTECYTRFVQPTHEGEKAGQAPQSRREACLRGLACVCVCAWSVCILIFSAPSLSLTLPFIEAICMLHV